MAGYLRWHIAINFDQLYLIEPIGDEIDMLIGYLAGGVPFGCKIYHDKGVFVDW